MSRIAPGWYKDPAEPTTQRYWDGEGWIGNPLPLDAIPPAGAPKETQAPPAPAPQTAGAQTPPRTPVSPGAGRAPGGRPLPQSPGWPPPPDWRPGMPLPPGLGLPPGASTPQGYPYVLVQPRPHGLPVAPLGLRFLARVIDIVLVTALNVIGNGWFVYLYVKDMRPYINAVWHQMSTGATNDLTAPARANTLSLVIPLVAMALWWAYEVPGIAHTGQTFGKRLVGIKVMALESTQPIGWVRAFRRWVPLGVPVVMWFCGIGFLLQFVDSLSPVLGGPLQMALHDRSALTVVVHCGRRGHEKVPEQTASKTEGQT